MTLDLVHLKLVTESCCGESGSSLETGQMRVISIYMMCLQNVDFHEYLSATVYRVYSQTCVKQELYEDTNCFALSSQLQLFMKFL